MTCICFYLDLVWIRVGQTWMWFGFDLIFIYVHYMCSTYFPIQMYHLMYVYYFFKCFEYLKLSNISISIYFVTSLTKDQHSPMAEMDKNDLQMPCGSSHGYRYHLKECVKIHGHRPWYIHFSQKNISKLLIYLCSLLTAHRSRLT